MGKSFDIGLESLTGHGVANSPAARGWVSPLSRGTFFLETFGGQMNEHDSEKVAGLLLSRGYRQAESPEAASLILYNTCTSRGKAAPKLFSRRGQYRPKHSRGQIIGGLGCVAPPQRAT